MLIDHLSFGFFIFVLKCRVLPLFCSNPDALGVDESEKGIFGSLNSIAQLPPSPPKEGGRLTDSVAGAAGDLSIGEASKESPAAGTGEWLNVIDWLFHRAFADVFCAFQTSRTGIDRRACSKC